MNIRISIISFLIPVAVYAQSFQEKLIQWSADQTLESASIGFKAIKTSDGSVVAELNSRKALVPASGMKLLTTAAALDILGDEKYYTTKVFYTGSIENGILKGDIIIKGAGDPSLGSQYFKGAEKVLNELSSAIKSVGINKIEGNIVADASVFPDYVIPRTWIWEDIGNYYGCGVSGLSWRDNTFHVYFSSPPEPDEPTEIVKIEPEVKNLKIDNRVLSSHINADRAYLFGGPYNYNKTAEGTIPKGRKKFLIKGSLPDPVRQFALEFKQALINSGISISGEVYTNRDVEVKNKTASQEKMQISEYRGMSIGNLVRYTNTKSVNLFAEHLLFLMGQEQFKIPSASMGIKSIEQFMDKWKIPTYGVHLVDGSGMSRFNTVTTQAMTSLLYGMKDNTTFRNSLAVSGQSGTFTAFMNSPQAKGRVVGKSGYMERVRSYHGFIQAESGEIAFSVIVNNYDCSAGEMKKKIEVLLMELLKE